MTVVEVPYFGGPADGTVFVADQERLAHGANAWAIVCVGGHYEPEKLPDGKWRLHFVDTVKR